jgi:hypothetical protein
VTIAHVPTSVVLQDLLDHAPAEQFTVRWLLERLDGQAFGIVILLLALIGMVPGICMLVAVLLLIPAVEMLAGRVVPIFPGWLADRPLPTRYLANAVRRANPILRNVEKAIHPRWRVPSELTSRIVGVAVIAMAVLLVAPIPMIQIFPASVIVILALAHIENDGLLLAIGVFGAVVMSTLAVMAVWQITLGAGWISRLFLTM